MISASGGTIYLNGGTFTAGLASSTSAITVEKANSFSENQEVTTVYCASEISGSAVCEVDGTEYGDLETAFSVVSDGGHTIHLLGDCSLDGEEVLTVDSNVILNLNGYTVTCDGVEIENSGTLMVTDGTIAGDITFNNKGTLQYSSGTISSTSENLFVNNGGSIEIFGGTIEHLGDGVCFAGHGGAITINGGTFLSYGSSCFYVGGYYDDVSLDGSNEGLITINDGVFRHSGNGALINQICAAVWINGGEFTVATSAPLVVLDGACGMLTINDGTFASTADNFFRYKSSSSDVTFNLYVTGGYFVAEQGNMFALVGDGFESDAFCYVCVGTFFAGNYAMIVDSVPCDISGGNFVSGSLWDASETDQYLWVYGGTFPVSSGVDLYLYEDCYIADEDEGYYIVEQTVASY